MIDIHFCHANGFPAKVYTPVLSGILEAKISFIPVIGSSKKALNLGVDSLTDELISEIEDKCSSPVVGIGHSMGGTIVYLAAVKRPDLFKDIILLEPVLWGATRRRIVRALRYIGLGDLGNPAVRTLKRRNHFEDKSEAIDYFSNRRIFDKMDSRCFEEYINHGLVECGNKFRLTIPPELESALFNCQLLNFPKNAYSIKGKIVYASNSNTLLKSDVRWLKKKMENMRFYEIDGGHMFPVETPDMTANLINELIEDI
ncbi:MAG: alpha/beta hydrolase [Pseudomonadales bacterium]|nr:alpha/beta hydrolase [Pseudomonadales bacterium]